MYAQKPGTGPGKTHPHKLPDTAYTKLDNLLTHRLPKPLNMRSFQRISINESQATMLELSKGLSSIVGNPEDEELMKGQDRGHGTRVLHARTMDRHNMEGERKLGVCFVASQSLLCDKTVSYKLQYKIRV